MTKNKKNNIWNRRSLIFNFAIADLKIRYRNSVLGFFWTFLEPLLMLVVLYIVFTSIFSSKIEHFPLYILLGIIVWNMFSRGTQMGLNSILARSSILSQVNLPREILPISSAVTSFFMVCFELVVFGIFLIVFKFIPTSTIIILPLVLFLELVLVVGISLPLSVLNVRYRDIQFIWTVVLQVGFFLTPIFYKLDVLPENIRNVLYYLPTVQILTVAHDVTLYNVIPFESLGILTVTTISIFVIGYLAFKRIEGRIIEEI